MIKFHRPSFLIAQPGTPSAQRTLLQKIFHKKKDDLSLDERRAMQMDVDRSSRKKILGGLISIERKRKEPDMQSLTKSTAEHLRALAARMRELDKKQEENDRANESQRIADMHYVEGDDEAVTRPSDAAAHAENLLRLALEEPDDEIYEAGNSDEERSVADTQSSKKIRAKIETPVEALAKKARRYMPAAAQHFENTNTLTESSIFTRTEQEASIRRAVADEGEKNDMYGEGWREILDEQNLPRNQVANEIVNVFSAAVRNGIDLSKVLSNDEITYLTRAMSLAKRPESLHVEHDNQPQKNNQGKETRKASYTGSFDPLKNIARQTAGLLHSSQVDRLLERMDFAASMLDESTRNPKTQPRISAGTVLENVDNVLATLMHIDPAELSRLCNQPGEQGGLAESRILGSLDNLKTSIMSLHDSMQKELASPESGSLSATEERQLKQAARLLEKTHAHLAILQNVSAQTVEEEDEPQASTSGTNSSDLFEIPTAALQASTSGTDSDDLFEIPTAAPPFSAPSATPLAPPNSPDKEISSEGEMQNRNALATHQVSPDLQAPSTSTSGPQHRRYFSHLPQLRHRPFSSLRLSTGTAASSQERKEALGEASPKKMMLADYLNISLSPKTPDSENDAIHSSKEPDAAPLPDGLGWPLGLKAFGGVVPSAITKTTRPNSRASEAVQLIEEMSAENPVNTGKESDAPGNWLEATGIIIAQNSGHGNDCLILSLLQHATGNYTGNAGSLEREAEELRQELIGAGFVAEFENNQMLPVDSDGFRELVNRVNARYPQANMDVRIAVIDASGRPFFPDTASASNAGETLPIAARPNPGGNPVAILHQDNHYAALYTKPVSVASDAKTLLDREYNIALPPVIPARLKNKFAVSSEPLTPTDARPLDKSELSIINHWTPRVTKSLFGGALREFMSEREALVNAMTQDGQLRDACIGLMEDGLRRCTDRALVMWQQIGTQKYIRDIELGKHAISDVYDMGIRAYRLAQVDAHALQLIKDTSNKKRLKKYGEKESVEVILHARESLRELLNLPIPQTNSTWGSDAGRIPGMYSKELVAYGKDMLRAELKDRKNDNLAFFLASWTPLTQQLRRLSPELEAIHQAIDTHRDAIFSAIEEHNGGDPKWSGLASLNSTSYEERLKQCGKEAEDMHFAANLAAVKTFMYGHQETDETQKPPLEVELEKVSAVRTPVMAQRFIPVLKEALANGQINPSWVHPINRWNLLHVAAASCDPDLVKALKELGVDMHQADNKGMLPLHVAASTGSAATIRALDDLENIGALDKAGNSPVHWVAYSGSVDALGALFQKSNAQGAQEALDQSPSIGVNVNIKNPISGQTPLHVAVMRDKFVMARMLIGAGADPQIKDLDNKTARDLLKHASAKVERKEYQLTKKALEMGKKMMRLQDMP